MTRLALLRAPIVVFLLVATLRLDAAERMVPGQWEFTMTTKGASHSSKSCVDAVKKYYPELAVDWYSLWGCATAQAMTTALTVMRAVLGVELAHGVPLVAGCQ